MPRINNRICYSCSLAGARAVGLSAACRANNHATIPLIEWEDRWSTETAKDHALEGFPQEAKPSRGRGLRPGPKPRFTDLALA